jgi:hypothetical protein
LLAVRRVQFKVDRRPCDVWLRHGLDIDDKLAVHRLLADKIDRIEGAVSASVHAQSPDQWKALDHHLAQSAILEVPFVP